MNTRPIVPRPTVCAHCRGSLERRCHAVVLESELVRGVPDGHWLVICFCSFLCIFEGGNTLGEAMKRHGGVYEIVRRIVREPVIVFEPEMFRLFLTAEQAAEAAARFSQ